MMETKSLCNEQEKKKSVCLRYMKGVCVYGKSCRYQHPPTENAKTTFDTKKPGMKSEVCSYYLQNKCKKGENCQYIHIIPKATKLEQRRDWLTFCHYYPTGKCNSKECRFLHVSKKDEDTFCATRKISNHLLEQAMCKALLQDVSFNGNASVCKALLQGYCDVDSCSYLHLSRQAYAEKVSGALTEKFQSIFGKSESISKPQETYHLESAGACHQSDSRHSNVVPDYGYERYNPWKPSYKNSSTWSNTKSNFDKQSYLAPESDSVIYGMQNLMKDDVNLIRSEGKGQTYDLREKLNRIAAENARHNLGGSNRQPYEDHRSSVCHISKEELKYQDTIRLLEKENMEMRRKLAELEGQQSNTFYKGRPGSLYQRENVDKGQRQGAKVEELGYFCDTIGDEDDRWYTSNPDVGNVPMTHRASSYYPPRPKLNKKMTYQHNHSEKHQYHGMEEYSKTDGQKYQKLNQQRHKEAKDHKSVPKGIQNQRKKHEESMASDQVKYIKPRMKKSMSESFNTSKNCDPEKSKKGKKSLAPKKMYDGQLYEENAEEVKTKDKTNEENISELEVVSEYLQKGETEVDSLDKDIGNVKDTEEIESKAATLQLEVVNESLQKDETQVESLNKDIGIVKDTEEIESKTATIQLEVVNESLQKDETQVDSLNKDIGIVKDTEEIENKAATLQGMLNQDVDTKDVCTESTKSEN